MAKRGSSTYKGTGTNAAAGLAGGPVLPSTPSKAKPNAKAVAKASPNASFKRVAGTRTAPKAVVKAKKAQGPRTMQSPDARSRPVAQSAARPSVVRSGGGIDLNRFAAEVQRNAQQAVRGVPVLGNIAAANPGFASFPTPAQTVIINRALRKR